MLYHIGPCYNGALLYVIKSIKQSKGVCSSWLDILFMFSSVLIKFKLHRSSQELWRMRGLLCMMTSLNGNIFRVTGQSSVNSPHKGQWRGALVFSLICVWINDWVNNREACDLRRYRAQYGVTVMWFVASLDTRTYAQVQCSSPSFGTTIWFK